MPLEPNQVALSDGRIVTLRETTGRDEIAASQMLGSHFTSDGAGQTLFTKAIVMRGIEDIDGKSPYKKPVTFKGFLNFWDEFKTRDSLALMAKYSQVNGSGEDPLDEKSDDETDESDSLQTPPDSESQSQ